MTIFQNMKGIIVMLIENTERLIVAAQGFNPLKINVISKL